MKIIIDQEGLQRRANLSHAASLGGLLILLGSVAISLWKPEWSTLASIMLFGGFATSVVGIYYANRWVKKPRPEEVLNQAFKRLNDQHRMYHYILGCDHVLLTPSNLMVIETCNLEGKFTYRDDKWRQKITPSRAMRFFVEEKLGDPIVRAQARARQIEALLVKDLPLGTNLGLHAMVVFTNPLAELHVENSPIPVHTPKKLHDRLPKGHLKFSKPVYQQIQEKLDEMAGLINTPR